MLLSKLTIVSGHALAIMRVGIVFDLIDKIADTGSVRLGRAKN